MSEKLYLLKVRLLYIEPPIWRRFVVPASTTLDRLHDVIQIAMGWMNYHLYEFIIGKKRYIEYEPLDYDDKGLESGKYLLGDIFRRKGRTLLYRYDFGDYWEHELVLEDNRYFNPQLRAPVECLEGERACPPEDVGGVGGYGEFCRAIDDPGDFEHKRYMEWSGGDYDSEYFDLDDVNWELIKYLRWSRDRYQDRVW